MSGGTDRKTTGAGHPPEGEDQRIRARRRRLSQARAARRQRLTWSLVAVLAVVALGCAAADSALFALDDVTVSGVRGARSERVADMAGLRPGSNLLRADLAEAEAQVESLPWVQRAHATRMPPSSVRIDVTARTPVAVVRAGDRAWIVDGEGVVVGGGQPAALPVIEAGGVELTPGRPVNDPALRNAIDVHKRLPGQVRQRVVRYEVDSVRGLRIKLSTRRGPATGSELPPPNPDGLWVRFGAAEQVAAKARTVAGLLGEELSSELRRQGDRVRVAELDVTAPEHPVLIPENPGEVAAPSGALDGTTLGSTDSSPASDE
jgi:cell division protein FtsQ